jgi:hypothetical protein
MATWRPTATSGLLPVVRTELHSDHASVALAPAVSPLRFLVLARSDCPAWLTLNIARVGPNSRVLEITHGACIQQNAACLLLRMLFLACLEKSFKI